MGRLNQRGFRKSPLACGTRTRMFISAAASTMIASEGPVEDEDPAEYGPAGFDLTAGTYKSSSNIQMPDDREYHFKPSSR